MLLWVLGVLLCLVILTVIALQISYVQQAAAKKLTAYFASKVNTRVSIGRFTTDWRNSLVLKEIYVEDQNRDTLLYARRLGLDLNMLALQNQKLKVRSARIDDGVLNLSTNPKDSLFNFQFILDALKKPKSGSSGKSVFELNNVHLKNVRFTLNDPVKGNFARAFIGDFTAKLDAVGTEYKTPGLGKLELKNSRVYFRKTKLFPPSESKETPAFTFDKLRLEEIDLRFENKPVGRMLAGKVGLAELNAEKILLEEMRADLKKLQISDTDLAVLQRKLSVQDSTFLARNDSVFKAGRSAAKTAGSGNWSVWLKQAEFENVGYRYDNQYFPKEKGLDLKHLDVRNLNLALENTYFSQNSITSGLKNLQLQEKSGLKILKAKASVKAIPGSVVLQRLEFKTASGAIMGNLEVDFGKKRSAGIKTQPIIKAVLSSVKISPKEVLQLAPFLAENAGFRKLGNHPVVAAGNFTRTGSGLYFQNMRMQLLTGTLLNFDGQVTGNETRKNQNIHLQIRSLKTNRNDLLALRGKSASKLRFPAQLSLSGIINRSQNSLRFKNLKVKTSSGTALHLNGTVTPGKAKTYLDLDVKSLQTSRGAILAMLPAGAVTPEVQLPDHIHFRGKYKGYSLQNFALNGRFTTTFGNVQTDIKVVPVQRFSGNIRLEHFNLGKLLKQEKTLGPVTGKADFRGKGFKVKTMELHYKADVKKFVYSGETYHNIRLEGDLNQKIYQLNGNLANAALQGLGHKLKKFKPKNLDLKKADPTRLIPKNIDPQKAIPKFLRKKKKDKTE